jgi:hypothetical protein
VGFIALLDANALHPIMACDLLLRFAETPTYRMLWSEEILVEAERSVVRRFPGKEAAIARRFRSMRESFPEAMVRGYDALTPAFSALGGDAHVLAAAVAGGARIIVTSNVRHFPAEILDPLEITAQTPDEFLVNQWWLSPADGHRIIDSIVEATGNPPLTRAGMLDRLQAHLPEFVALARAEAR